MASNTNTFWDGTDFDAPPAQTPPQDLLNGSPNWDGLFNCKERPDSKKPAELHQGSLPYSSEPEDRLVENIKKLQDIQNRALVSDASVIQTTPVRDDDAFATINTTARNPSHNSPRLILREESPILCPPCGISIRGGESAYVEESINCATPTPGHPTDLLYTTVLYSWDPVPDYGGREVDGIQNTNKAMQELKEMEQHLQAETKRRIIQLEQSYEDDEPGPPPNIRRGEG
ncbi:hypothetical protein F5Y03DRAFT_367045 [Xylaria venustula]|nr:hypothetical protein F5Y03DRAFT_367045 [Xylaria venustula]